jgi:hypothetical protein
MKNQPFRRVDIAPRAQSAPDIDPVAKAFEVFGIDPKHLLARDLLLHLLAEAFFTPSKPRGRPKIKLTARKWNPERRLALVMHCQQIVPSIGFQPSNKHLAALVKERFPEAYRHDSVEMIRQTLSLGLQAKNPGDREEFIAEIRKLLKTTDSGVDKL